MTRSEAEANREADKSRNQESADAKMARDIAYREAEEERQRQRHSDREAKEERQRQRYANRERS